MTVVLEDLYLVLYFNLKESNNNNNNNSRWREDAN